MCIYSNFYSRIVFYLNIFKILFSYLRTVYNWISVFVQFWGCYFYKLVFIFKYSTNESVCCFRITRVYIFSFYYIYLFFSLLFVVQNNYFLLYGRSCISQPFYVFNADIHNLLVLCTSHTVSCFFLFILSKNLIEKSFYLTCSSLHRGFYGYNRCFYWE